MDYQAVMEEAQKENKTVQTFETEDGEGNVVKVAACSDDLYVTARSAPVYATPGETGEILAELILGEQVLRSAVCDNSWSKISVEKEGKKLIGYLRTQYLSDDIEIEPVEDEAEVKADSSILDYPGRKDGEIVGEVLEFDKVKRTGTVNDVWSRILYQDEKGEEKTGYIPTSVLDLPEAVKILERLVGSEMCIRDSLIGSPVAASSDANLKPLGKFRITHYCPCSICCGPWANGITSTGVTATTNHTIAVDPSQIPYGSQVVINGQVYVAEDCGGAIKTNCIDIYVATHDEGESKGVYYTDVYLIQ